MKVRKQTNIEYDVDVLQALDRIAAKQSISRPDLLRRIADEAIAADADGREPFTAVAQAMTGEDFQHMGQRIGDLTTKLERVVRDDERRDGKFHQVAKAYESDAEAARERGERRLREELSEALLPFTQQLSSMQKSLELAIANQPRLDAIDASINAARTATTAERQELRKIASQPRTENNLVLSDKRKYRFGFLVALSLMLGVALMFLFLALASTTTWSRAFVGDRILQNDQAVCGYIDGRYGGTKCQVPPVPRFVEPASAKRKSAR